MLNLEKIIKIKRIEQNDDGIFGVIIDGNIPFALTVERKWINNQPNISCIPAGEYICKRINSPEFGDTFEVMNVPNRSHILLHKGNIMDDSHGCIIIGEQFESMKNKTAVLASWKGFSEFKERTQGWNFFKLIIINCF